jgi:NitT/TauT family transport system substrate-binding protein
MFRHSGLMIFMLVTLVLTYVNRVSLFQLHETSSEAHGVVRLGYLANLTHAQALLGVQSGEFARAVAPVSFTSKAFNAGPAVLEAIFADQIDMAYIGPGPAILGHKRSHGEGLRLIAGSASNGALIVASKASNISSLSELKGRRLATSQHGNTQDLSARNFVKSQFGEQFLASIRTIPNAEMLGLFDRGELDAAWVAEPWGTLLVERTGAKILAEEKSLWPDQNFLLTALIVSTKYLQKYPEVVKKILQTHIQLTTRLQDYPEEQVAALSQAMLIASGKEMPQDIIRKSLAHIAFNVEASPTTISTYAKWMIDLGFVDGKVATETLIDTSLLESLDATK